ncbi:MAG: EcsC family protein [Gammaproteobacteria bacterium]|nr:EcsC family protein [Gammaproteobacteria bacterium]
MNQDEVNQLTKAIGILENPNFAIKAAGFVGMPVEKVIGLLPNSVQEKISVVAQKAILGALKVSLKTMNTTYVSIDSAPPEASNWWHTTTVAASGGVAGFFGIGAVAAEIPISTTIMMRSIADVARSEGANLNEIETLLECVQIFALGGISTNDDAAEIGYFVAREALAKAITDAAAHIAKHGVTQEGAPAIVRLINLIAERYSLQISEKTAATVVPLIGAAGGALINTLFITHFQDVAKAHFLIRRLEKLHGQELVKIKYAEIRGTLRIAKS